ncbi:hypothetical protein MTR67_052043 [Solanum verrucosum]|uniref:Uncharacterized protein n=1 Tax=Solanum verrucosum TaxID=315347 RepID=A0AAF0V4D2_SOLVR|nr:hypothetical protein MTR67_052043 [Solanum verrucosum]
MEQSACRRVVPRGSTEFPNDSKCKDVEGKSKKVMESTKRWIAECIGDPDKLRRVICCNINFQTL